MAKSVTFKRIHKSVTLESLHICSVMDVRRESRPVTGRLERVEGTLDRDVGSTYPGNWGLRN